MSFAPLLLLTLAPAAAPITVNSLLAEMTDREAAARRPAVPYRLAQASSHDPRKRDPWDAATWHSNEDYGQFLRAERNQGRREWVIMEDSGPGAIVRFWLPLDPSKDKQNIRFYFDGAETPALTANFNDLLSGRGLVKPPLAFAAWDETDLRHQAAANKPQRGVAGDLYLPIPYATGCKITLDQLPFYYVINYRRYLAGTPVETVTPAGLEAAADAIAQAGAALLADPALDSGQKATAATLAPGQEVALDLPAGPQAVGELQVKVDPTQAPQVLRSLVLTARFDDQDTVWCPLGEFFGTGVRLSAVRDFFRRCETDGTLTAFWPLPYQHAARLTIKNLGAVPATVTLSALARPWAWDERSLYFHCDWHALLGTKTRPMSDMNYLEISGQGVYAGDSLTVFSPVAAWYGEGDERIYLDGETFPSHIGTGTEDYYGMAWGMADYFSSPFLSMPRRDRFNRGDWRGYTSNTRLRRLDAIYFERALKVDLECWDWADTTIDDTAACFWYGAPGAKSNRVPQPAEAALALKELAPEPPPFKIAGAIEAEGLTPTATSDGLHFAPQDAGLVEGRWSGGAQLFVTAARVGDWLELELPADGAGPRQVSFYATQAGDYGILKFTVNGQPALAQWDGYATQPKAVGPVTLGTFEPVGGKFRVRIEVVGSNPAAHGAKTYFGIDCFVLSKP